MNELTSAKPTYKSIRAQVIGLDEKEVRLCILGPHWAWNIVVAPREMFDDEVRRGRMMSMVINDQMAVKLQPTPSID